MTFSVIFVDRQVVMVRHIVSRKTRKYPNLSNEGSERTSTQTTQTAELEFWCQFMPSEGMVRQAMSQYTRKKFVYQLAVYKIFPRSP